MNINTVQWGAILWAPWKGESETRTQVVYLGSNSREQAWGADKCDREEGKPNRDSILYRSRPWAVRDLMPLGSLQHVFQHFLLAVRRLEPWSTGCVPYSWRLASGQIMPPPPGACFAWEQRKSPPTECDRESELSTEADTWHQKQARGCGFHCCIGLLQSWHPQLACFRKSWMQMEIDCLTFILSSRKWIIELLLREQYYWLTSVVWWILVCMKNWSHGTFQMS